nr:dehydrodolichyl diphosphate synthase complex subunit nus1 isoform X2 [Ipomoea batatas]
MLQGNGFGRKAAKVLKADFLGIAQTIESFLISSGFWESYKSLNISKIQHLAVVIDCEEARETSKVLELLQFLATIGVKNVSLYDSEGVLKQSKEAIKEELSRIKFFEVEFPN